MLFWPSLLRTSRGTLWQYWKVNCTEHGMVIGPCDGRLVLKSDGTYGRKLYGPSGSNSDGSWTYNLDYVGRALPWKLVQLDDATLAIRYGSTRKQSP